MCLLTQQLDAILMHINVQRAIKQWNIFAGYSNVLSYFLQALCTTRARAACHFDFMAQAGGSWWRQGVFGGGCERGWLYERLMLLFVTDMGRGEQWAAVWYSDIIYSAKKKKKKEEKDINKMSFVTMGP